MLVLSQPVGTQDGQDRVIEVDSPAALRALGALELDLPSKGAHGLAYVQRLALPVDGAPCQAQQLALTEPGHEGQEPYGPIYRLVGHGDELLRLLGCPV